MIERLGVSSNEKRFLPSKPFLPFSSKFYNTNYTIYTILRFATEEETQLHCSRSIDNFLEISFLRHRDEVVVYLATRGLPSVVCNYRSCEGVTHQEQTVYTVGCLSIPVVTITSTARRAFVWATRHEIGGENRSRDAECETREHGCFQAKCLLYAFIAGLYASRGITEEGGIAGECMQRRFFTDIRYLIRR